MVGVLASRLESVTFYVKAEANDGGAPRERYRFVVACFMARATQTGRPVFVIMIQCDHVEEKESFRAWSQPEERNEACA
jgi:hypothetical protein